jgi:hypothetical protein
MPPDGKVPVVDGTRFNESCNKFTLEQLEPYFGKYVAFSLDGTRIVASGSSSDALSRDLRAKGYHFSQVVHGYIDEPDRSLVGGLFCE